MSHRIGLSMNFHPSGTIDTPLEFVEAVVVFSAICATILVPFVTFLKPSPRAYWNFIRDAWNVRQEDTRLRWLQHYFTAVFTSGFLSQAVKTTLHYPLLQTYLGATVLHVGLIDAGSGLFAAILDYTFRTTIWRGMRRPRAFGLSSILQFIGLTFIIGIVARSLSEKVGQICLLGICMSSHSLALLAVTFAQVFSDLNMNFVEFGVMRSDACSDISHALERWSDFDGDENAPPLENVPPLTATSSLIRTNSAKKRIIQTEITMRMAQLSTVCQYPAIIVSTMVFSRRVSYSADNKNWIFDSYVCVGFLNLLFGLLMSICWMGYAKRPPTMSHTSTFRSHDPISDMLPGGVYFKVAKRVGLYNASLHVVRSGYIRLMNLKAIQLQSVSETELTWLFYVTFGIAFCFFWLADTASSGQNSQDKARVRLVKQIEERMIKRKLNAEQRNRVLASTVSLALMGLGHFSLAMATGFYGLLMSAVIFGFGQATSTGARTSLKDDLRVLLRSCDLDEHYEKKFIRVLSSFGTFATILTSLMVGLVGSISLSLVSCVYTLIAGMGIWNSLVSDMNVRNAVMEIAEKSKRHYSMRIESQPPLSRNLLDGS